MAYITTARANDLLVAAGDTSRWDSAAAGDQAEAVQRASNRIEVIPFVNDDTDYPVRPRYTDGATSGGASIPTAIELAVAFLAAFYIRRPLVGFREPEPQSEGPLYDIPEEVRNALWKYLDPSLKGDDGDSERAQRALDLREKEINFRQQATPPALSLGYVGSPSSSGGGGGTPSPGSSFGRDNLIAGTHIQLDDVGSDSVRISATGEISSTDQVARDAASDNAGNIAELQTEISTASQSIASNEGRITTAEGKITALENRPSGGGGSTDLSAYRTASDQDIIDARATQGILDARGEARTADGKAVVAQQQAAALDTRVTANSGRIGTNETSISTAEGKIASLETADSTIGTDIDALQLVANDVVVSTHWVRNDSARDIQVAVRWLTVIPRNTRISFSIGGTPATVSAPAEISAGSWVEFTVPISAGNARTITREANTAL